MVLLYVCDAIVWKIISTASEMVNCFADLLAYVLFFCGYISSYSSQEFHAECEFKTDH